MRGHDVLPPAEAERDGMPVAQLGVEEAFRPEDMRVAEGLLIVAHCPAQC